MTVGVTFGDIERVKPYEEALRAAGLEPVRLRAGAGLLLTGGTDLDPALYGQPPHPKAQPPDRARDRLELDLLRDALARRIPILAICRGLQLLNVAQGGTLYQDVPGHSFKPPRLHVVRISPGSRLAGIVGPGEYEVNSRHHQAVDRLGTGLVPTAVSPDGVIEALELPDHPFGLAVQWHPEDRVAASEGDRRLFQAFAEAVRAR